MASPLPHRRGAARPQCPGQRRQAGYRSQHSPRHRGQQALGWATTARPPSLPSLCSKLLMLHLWAPGWSSVSRETAFDGWRSHRPGQEHGPDLRQPTNQPTNLRWFHLKPPASQGAAVTTTKGNPSRAAPRAAQPHPVPWRSTSGLAPPKRSVWGDVAEHLESLEQVLVAALPRLSWW